MEALGLLLSTVRCILLKGQDGNASKRAAALVDAAGPSTDDDTDASRVRINQQQNHWEQQSVFAGYIQCHPDAGTRSMRRFLQRCLQTSASGCLTATWKSTGAWTARQNSHSEWQRSVALNVLNISSKAKHAINIWCSPALV